MAPGRRFLGVFGGGGTKNKKKKVNNKKGDNNNANIKVHEENKEVVTTTTKPSQQKPNNKQHQEQPRQQQQDETATEATASHRSTTAADATTTTTSPKQRGSSKLRPPPPVKKAKSMKTLKTGSGSSNSNNKRSSSPKIKKAKSLKTLSAVKESDKTTVNKEEEEEEEEGNKKGGGSTELRPKLGTTTKKAKSMKSINTLTATTTRLAELESKLEEFNKRLVEIELWKQEIQKREDIVAMKELELKERSIELDQREASITTSKEEEETVQSKVDDDGDDDDDDDNDDKVDTATKEEEEGKEEDDGLTEEEREAALAERKAENIKRKKMIKDELHQIIKQTEEEELDPDDPFEPEAIQALKKAAPKICFLKKFYDVMKDELIYFPSVSKSILDYSLMEEAEKYYWEEDDEFPMEYSIALRTVVSSKINVDDDDDGADDDYMAALAMDVEIMEDDDDDDEDVDVDVDVDVDGDGDVDGDDDEKNDNNEPKEDEPVSDVLQEGSTHTEEEQSETDLVAVDSATSKSSVSDEDDDEVPFLPFSMQTFIIKPKKTDSATSKASVLDEDDDKEEEAKPDEKSDGQAAKGLAIHPFLLSNEDEEEPIYHDESSVPSPSSSPPQTQQQFQTNFDIDLGGNPLEDDNNEGMDDSKDRRSRIVEELDKILNQVSAKLLDDDIPLKPKAVKAIKKAAPKVAYRKRFYDVETDRNIEFPTVARTIVDGSIFEEARKAKLTEEQKSVLLAIAEEIETTTNPDLDYEFMDVVAEEMSTLESLPDEVEEESEKKDHSSSGETATAAAAIATAASDTTKQQVTEAEVSGAQQQAAALAENKPADSSSSSDDKAKESTQPSPFGGEDDKDGTLETEAVTSPGEKCDEGGTQQTISDDFLSPTAIASPRKSSKAKAKKESPKKTSKLKAKKDKKGKRRHSSDDVPPLLDVDEGSAGSGDKNDSPTTEVGEDCTQTKKKSKKDKRKQLTRRHSSDNVMELVDADEAGSGTEAFRSPRKAPPRKNKSFDSSELNALLSPRAGAKKNKKKKNDSHNKKSSNKEGSTDSKKKKKHKKKKPEDSAAMVDADSSHENTSDLENSAKLDGQVGKEIAGKQEPVPETQKETTEPALEGTAKPTAENDEEKAIEEPKSESDESSAKDEPPQQDHTEEGKDLEGSKEEPALEDTAKPTAENDQEKAIEEPKSESDESSAKDEPPQQEHTEEGKDLEGSKEKPALEGTAKPTAENDQEKAIKEPKSESLRSIQPTVAADETAGTVEDATGASEPDESSEKDEPPQQEHAEEGKDLEGSKEECVDNKKAFVTQGNSYRKQPSEGSSVAAANDERTFAAEPAIGDHSTRDTEDLTLEKTSDEEATSTLVPAEESIDELVPSSQEDPASEQPEPVSKEESTPVEDPATKGVDANTEESHSADTPVVDETAPTNEPIELAVKDNVAGAPQEDPTAASEEETELSTANEEGKAAVVEPQIETPADTPTTGEAAASVDGEPDVEPAINENPEEAPQDEEPVESSKPVATEESASAETNTMEERTETTDIPTKEEALSKKNETVELAVEQESPTAPQENPALPEEKSKSADTLETVEATATSEPVDELSENKGAPQEELTAVVAEQENSIDGRAEEAAPDTVQTDESIATVNFTIKSVEAAEKEKLQEHVDVVAAEQDNSTKETSGNEPRDEVQPAAATDGANAHAEEVAVTSEPTEPVVEEATPHVEESSVGEKVATDLSGTEDKIIAVNDANSAPVQQDPGSD